MILRTAAWKRARSVVFQPRKSQNFFVGQIFLFVGSGIVNIVAEGAQEGRHLRTPPLAEVRRVLDGT